MAPAHKGVLADSPGPALFGRAIIRVESRVLGPDMVICGSEASSGGMGFGRPSQSNLARGVGCDEMLLAPGWRGYMT